MADTEGKIYYNINFKLDEIVLQDSSKKGSNWVDIAIPSTECFTPTSHQTYVDNVKFKDAETDKAADGYHVDGSRYYVHALNTGGFALSSAISYVKAIYIKHTGYEYSSATTLSATTNYTDNLLIRGGAADGFIIACLAPFQSIFLPVLCDTGWSAAADIVTSNEYYFKSVEHLDLSNGSNGIAVEFICVEKYA